MDLDDIEQEQLAYIKKNGISVPSEEQYPDPLTKNLDVPVVLDQEQEKKILEELKFQLQQKAIQENTPIEKIQKNSEPFTLSSYIRIMSKSFIGIMDDLLNFGGNLEEFSIIFTKDNRLVFVASVLIVVALVLLNNRNQIAN